MQQQQQGQGFTPAESQSRASRRQFRFSKVIKEARADQRAKAYAKNLANEAHRETVPGTNEWAARKFAEYAATDAARRVREQEDRERDLAQRNL